MNDRLWPLAPVTLTISRWSERPLSAEAGIQCCALDNAVVECPLYARLQPFAIVGFSPSQPRGFMQQESQDPNWTTVDRFFHPTDAHIAAGKLDSEGIPVFLLGINHASANWLISIALGGIRLQVPAIHVDDARQLLTQIGELSEYGESECPECAGSDTTVMSNSWKIAFLAVNLFNFPLPWQSNRRHCQSCGAEWETTKNG